MEITFATPTPTPPAIRLLVEADRPDNVQNATYALAGFEVVGATSQYGQVNLFSQGDHRLAWNVGELAQRTSKRLGINHVPHGNSEQISVYLTLLVACSTCTLLIWQLILIQAGCGFDRVIQSNEYRHSSRTP